MSDSSYEKLNIQWYPGHMTKARRMIEENISLVDAVCEVLDARIPYASANPDIRRLSEGKPHLVVLNRCDLADPSLAVLRLIDPAAFSNLVLQEDGNPSAHRCWQFPRKVEAGSKSAGED